jgi:formamidopyrimidine-DNA glycosylase
VPELPEVETTRRAILPYVVGHRVADVVVRDPRLRYGVDAEEMQRELCGRRIDTVERRGKYLLFHCENGALLVHLGMSGSLRIVTKRSPVDKHDHFDLLLDNGCLLRLRDPRRFGSIVWTHPPVHCHRLLRHLGPEPDNEAFSGRHLFDVSRGRTVPVKQLLMDSQVVVGVGNIYANEALFAAGISPFRQAGKISEFRYERLAQAVRAVLARAIEAGGTTLRDFVSGEGSPGYFQQRLRIYGRAGESCFVCGHVVKCRPLGQRATYYCGHCQH